MQVQIFQQMYQFCNTLLFQLVSQSSGFKFLDKTLAWTVNDFSRCLIFFINFFKPVLILLSFCMPHNSLVPLLVKLMLDGEIRE